MTEEVTGNIGHGGGGVGGSGWVRGGDTVLEKAFGADREGPGLCGPQRAQGQRGSQPGSPGLSSRPAPTEPA